MTLMRLRKKKRLLKPKELMKAQPIITLKILTLSF
jgi:hypothetical protein